MINFAPVLPGLIHLTHSRFIETLTACLSGGCVSPRALIRDLPLLPLLLGRVLRANPRLIYATTYPSQIDGKTLRQSFDTASAKAAIHLVSAWASQQHLLLGEVKTEAKSNEIMAIPLWLKLLELQGCMVTIDARVKASELYANYCQWCEENSEYPKRQRSFSVRLSERGFIREKSNSANWWLGIELQYPSTQQYPENGKVPIGES